MYEVLGSSNSYHACCISHFNLFISASFHCFGEKGSHSFLFLNSSNRLIGGKHRLLISYWKNKQKIHDFLSDEVKIEKSYCFSCLQVWSK